MSRKHRRSPSNSQQHQTGTCPCLSACGHPPPRMPLPQGPTPPHAACPCLSARLPPAPHAQLSARLPPCPVYPCLSARPSTLPHVLLPQCPTPPAPHARLSARGPLPQTRLPSLWPPAYRMLKFAHSGSRGLQSPQGPSTPHPLSSAPCSASLLRVKYLLPEPSLTTPAHRHRPLPQCLGSSVPGPLLSMPGRSSLLHLESPRPPSPALCLHAHTGCSPGNHLPLVTSF